MYIVDYTPFFLLGAEEKKDVIRDLYAHRQNVLLFREGWLVPSNIHNVARNGIALIYFFFLARLLFNSKYYKAFLIERRTLDWLRISTFMFFLLTLTGIMTLTMLPSPGAWPFTVLTILGIFLVISLILFLEPHILYGEEQLEFEPNHDKNKHQQFSLQAMEHTGVRLRNFIRNRGYLQKNIKLDEVANDLGVKPYMLSAYINQEYQMHFNDLINQYRIQYIKEGIINEQWKDLTLEAIAEKAGFNNRNTFLSAFKKSTGMTPTSFMRMHRGNHLKKPESEEEGS
jgi:AraC-like DNA-binding protein